MTRVADVGLRVAAPRRPLGPLVVLLVATVAMVGLLALAYASPESPPNRSGESGGGEQAIEGFKAGIGPRGGAPYWLFHGGPAQTPRDQGARPGSR
jgi:hypothetical protein